jgi:hypothetical protein
VSEKPVLRDPADALAQIHYHANDLARATFKGAQHPALVAMTAAYVACGIAQYAAEEGDSPIVDGQMQQINAFCEHLATTLGLPEKRAPQDYDVQTPADVFAEIHYHAWRMASTLPQEHRYPELIAMVVAYIACELALYVIEQNKETVPEDVSEIRTIRDRLRAFHGMAITEVPDVFRRAFQDDMH